MTKLYKPSSLLILFSREEVDYSDSIFSGHMVLNEEINYAKFEIDDEDDVEIHKRYDHQALAIAYFYQTVAYDVGIFSHQLEPFTHMTQVFNYDPQSITMAMMTGKYDYPLVIDSEKDYKFLAKCYSEYRKINSIILWHLNLNDAFKGYAKSSFVKKNKESKKAISSTNLRLGSFMRRFNYFIRLYLNKVDKNFNPKHKI